MPLEYLKPLPKTFAKQYKPQQIGNRITKYVEGTSLPNVEGFDIAIFSVMDLDSDVYQFREELYHLFVGNWHKKVLDLGVIIASDREEDTIYAVRELCEFLLRNKIKPILVGGHQSLLLPVYQSFGRLEQFVNMVGVDAKFDLGNEIESISTSSYMSQIFSEQPTHLQNFANIGYQSYYVAQEELDLIENMVFEAHRLGVFIADITEAEPILRNADLTAINMSCVQAKDLDISNGYPNGFSSREICNIARYTGLSCKNQCVGIFNLPNSKIGNGLVAQVIWYILEGINFRREEFPTENDDNYIKYNVIIDDYRIEFFKSILTQRWWIRPYHKEDDKITIAPMIPCNKKEYDEALEGVIPERWWKAYRLV